MTKTYLLSKCGAGECRPVCFFTADGAIEAREAPTWLRRHHVGDPELTLGPGEFFEVLERDQCSAEDWSRAEIALAGKTVAGKPRSGPGRA